MNEEGMDPKGPKDSLLPMDLGYEECESESPDIGLISVVQDVKP